MKKTKLYTLLSAQSDLFAISITAIISWAFTFLALFVFKDYAWTLFVWLPFVIGALTTILAGYHKAVPRTKLYNLSLLTLVVYSAGILAFAWDGLICLLMAFPLAWLFTWAGHWAGYKILQSRKGNASAAVLLLLVSVPCLMAFENNSPEKEELRSVKTSLEIAASPRTVWQHVIAFPQLDEPDEFIFKTGIAYPVNATINGHGVGAVRHCNFSTGSFVEPITVWDEPRLLRFSVAAQPETMRELSFYPIKPTHLHGYWVSKKGQFKLTPLANGNTLVEGTTWYVNKIKPDLYWTIWSDFIVHKIHQRVLNHIKTQAEK
jgi:hypothetical protein